jgi:lipopolysaccharide/colanic/teichoic acid biosynthesis glycosyltransferase
MLVLALPAIGVSAVLVRVTSPGPAIYSQWRHGRDGQAFRAYKIRTMRTDAAEILGMLRDTDAGIAEEWELYGCLAEDPRVIPYIGSWLRKSSLDELPQLFNVLRGEMSLVGPRPLPLELAQMLPADQVQARSTVRPGLTGLWQVRGRSDLDLAALLALDRTYVDEWSLRLDLSILLRTPMAVLSRRGAY